MGREGLVAFFLYLCACLAALVYLGTVTVLIQDGVKIWPALSANPLWLLVAVVALGLGRLVQVAERTHEVLRRLEGWKSAEGSRLGHKGPSILEILEQIRDKGST
jgi:hypothetical protein